MTDPHPLDDAAFEDAHDIHQDPAGPIVWPDHDTEDPS